MNQKVVQEVVKKQLEKNPRWQLKALQVLYNRQTVDEQISMQTTNHNGKGFTAFDAKVLTDLALKARSSRLKSYHYDTLSKRLPKYWRQIVEVSDPVKLERIVSQVGNVVRQNG